MLRHIVIAHVQYNTLHVQYDVCELVLCAHTHTHFHRLLVNFLVILLRRKVKAWQKHQKQHTMGSGNDIINHQARRIASKAAFRQSSAVWACCVRRWQFQLKQLSSPKAKGFILFCSILRLMPKFCGEKWCLNSLSDWTHSSSESSLCCSLIGSYPNTQSK